jgi:fumarylacetoacetase
MHTTFLTIAPDSHFPLNNLPYGVFRCSKSENFRVGAAIGDYVLDLAVLEKARLLKASEKVFSEDSLNAFMALGYEQWFSVRQELLKLLHADCPDLRDNGILLKKALYKYSDCELKLPVNIPDYTDFFTSEQHAINLGKMFRPDNEPLVPQWKHMPIAYHGRSSSIVVSTTPVKRPYGQILNEDKKTCFGQSQLLDIEVEFAYFIGTGNQLGTSITTKNAHKHVFGAVLVNDWSARDIQKWEYVPLGPFLGKNFATSISPWVVSLFALEEFYTDAPKQDIPVLDYLKETDRKIFDINLALALKTDSMSDYETIANTNTKYSYWTYQQMIAHHTINGCNLRTGDLLASGTISGPNPQQFGSLIELTYAGQKPLNLGGNQQRIFLEDGDSVRITGTCRNTAKLQLGFGEVEGTIISA